MLPGSKGTLAAFLLPTAIFLPLSQFFHGLDSLPGIIITAKKALIIHNYRSQLLITQFYTS